ncbi:MAG: 5'-methylthioadenosine phosphorylase [Bermanella sp.]|nr:5'-methylthioadenosine phosphorylase [Bermanella sp.]|tara:strand:- start:875 stop:1636 length:762 start_codon:yes stop_codon:yes gene_type:complete
MSNASSLTAIIGGTGLNEYPSLLISHEKVVTTDLGATSAPLVFGELMGQSVVFLARHGHPHKLPPHKVNYRANMLALKQAGVSEIIAVNAVGGISENMAPEAICIPDQIIDYTHGREDTFFDGIYRPLDHVDFTYPYDQDLAAQLSFAAESKNIITQKTGVYGATQGPRLETIAEINRLEKDGCDVVGMTGMPEAVLARELELPYACLALVVNRAAGKSDRVITMDDIRSSLEVGMHKIHAIIAGYLASKDNG